MNNLFRIFFILFSLSCYSQSKIEIIEFSIEAPLAIKCENFNNYFKDEVRNISLNKIKEDRMFDLISKLKSVDVNPYLDVRYKGYLIYKRKKYFFCGDSKSIKINEKYYLTSAELMIFFDKLLETNK